MWYNVLEKTYPDGTVQRKYYSKALMSDYTRQPLEDSGDYVEKGEIQNLSRAKQVIYDLARSNEWSYMVTLTFDDSCVFRDDYSSVTAVLTNWIQSIRRTYGCKWLLVPEFHSDGKTYHFHGLIAGSLPVVPAVYHDVSDRPYLEGKEVWYKDNSGALHQVFNISNWRYGFSTATLIQDQKRVSSYMTKYITKETQSAVPKGRKRYWASRSLLKPKEERLQIARYDFQALSHGARYTKTYKDIFENEIILTET